MQPISKSENSESVDLGALLGRESVEDIVISPRGLSYYESFSWHGPFASSDCEPKQIWYLANKIAEEARLQLGVTQPSVDSFLCVSPQVCLRAHVVVAPLVFEGPEITLRRLPSLDRFRLEDFDMDPTMRERLEQSVRRGDSILVSGSTGSGKTSFLTALMKNISPSERVLVLEDSPELPLPSPLCTKLVCQNNRFGFREGATWTLEDLVFESLRMRPDRIVVGECRSREALAIRQALQTGHRGTWTTIHGASPREALMRFDALCSLAAETPRERVWDLVIQLGRNHEGRRAIVALDFREEETL
ncbi:MAG: ATPase, T2SS/T4P/T4SS family [Bdellovibrionota bacterium]